MALFPHLDLENGVQINDRTRFVAKRSFVSKGAAAMTTMTVKPGADATAVSVFNVKLAERYLDWQFSSFSIDIDATNNKLDFNEGGSELTATLTSGTYTLATLATEIKTQLDAAGALTYTVTVSDADKITIAANGSFSLLPATGTNRLVSILPILRIKPKPGFDDSDYANKTTITGKRIRKLPRAVTLTIGDGTTTASKVYYIDVFSVAGDALFATDSELRAHRHDLPDFLPEERDTFLHIHRRVQALVLEFMDRAGKIDVNGDPLEIDAFTNPDEVKQWAVFAALRIIHDELSNDPEDDFWSKARDFQALEELHRDRAIVRVDIDGDGKADEGEGVYVTGGTVMRR